MAQPLSKMQLKSPLPHWQGARDFQVPYLVVCGVILTRGLCYRSFTLCWRRDFGFQLGALVSSYGPTFCNQGSLCCESSSTRRSRGSTINVDSAIALTSRVEGNENVINASFV